MPKTIFALLFSIISMQSFAAEYTVQKVKFLGPMKNKVIFQSSDLKKVKGKNVLKGKLVAQWGLHVFEVVNGFYTCNQKNVCKLSDYERVATFESCTVKNKTKVECRKKIGSGTSSSDTSGVIIYDSPDSVNDEFYRQRRYNDEYSEFPVRIDGEFDDLF